MTAAMPHRLIRATGTAIGLLMLVLLMPSCSGDLPLAPTRAHVRPQFLVAPANDSFANAVLVSALPFSDSVDLSLTTTEADEQLPTCASAGPWTAWYAFTPTDSQWVSASASEFEGIVAVWQGTSLASLNPVACAAFGSALRVRLAAGETYYVQASGLFYWAGTLHLTLEAILPPANDSFAAAKAVTALPFEQRLDIIAASTQPGEPTPSCVDPSGIGSTVWYSFTPAASGSYAATAVDPWGFSAVVAAYTGSGLNSLTEVGCQPYQSPLVFHASKGTAYYFQLSAPYGQGGPVTFRLESTPPPVASFFFNPGDPSAFDSVAFTDNSYDPANVGIDSRAWNFGDGTTATDCCPTHRYGADGDYTVQLTVTTSDGRTASTSQVVHVATHDVAITRFTTPNAASVGQTRTIVVGVNSRRRAEWVEVQLYKSIAGGYLYIGGYTQLIPQRGSNRTTDFAFSYSFTARDAQIGKVTFKAIATLTNFRDALPADNEAISPPTKVSK